MVCSFGAFASNGITELSVFEKVNKIIETLNEESPNLIIIYVKGEGWSSYDDGNPECITIIRVNGYLASPASAVGSGCP